MGVREGDQGWSRHQGLRPLPPKGEIATRRLAGFLCLMGRVLAVIPEIRDVSAPKA